MATADEIHRLQALQEIARQLSAIADELRAIRKAVQTRK
jgi:hypothetical protein